MKLLITDTETTGLTDGSVCEIAVTLYQISFENKRQTGILASASTLIPVVSNPAERINGITAELSQLCQSDSISDESIGWLKKIASVSDYAIAFNAEFEAAIFITGGIIPVNITHGTEPFLLSNA